MIKSIRNLSFIAIALFSACTDSQKTDEKQTNALLDTVSLSNRAIALAYQNGDKIVATSIDTLKQISFGSATDPAISPDGNKFAYTVSDSSGHKSVWIADMENKMQSRLVVNYPDYFGASWAPDGKNIAINVLSKNGLETVALVKTDQSGYVTLDGSSNTNLYGPTWKNDTEVLVHDLKNLYIYTANGKKIDTKNIASQLGIPLNITKNSRFFFVENGTQLIFNAGNAATGNNMVQSVYLINLADKKLSKLSPAEVHVSHLFVTSDDRIFFSGTENGADQSKIYTSDLKGTIKILIDKGSNPTATLK